MKHITFIRHGQTVLNKKWVHQYPETMLSELGHQQAKTAAEALKNEHYDLIIASPLLRTVQTAAYFREGRDTPYLESELFVELRRPRNLWGVSWAHPKSIYIMGLLYLNAHMPNYHFTDEENLEDFHARARRGLEFLAARPEERILVVTHRGLMVNLRERMRHDGMDTIKQYQKALWTNFEVGNCCYFRATWVPEGENGITLDGTWNVEDGVVCPVQKTGGLR